MKLNLKLSDEVKLYLAPFPNQSKEVSDILERYVTKGQEFQKSGKSKRGILNRTYAYHKRVVDIKYTREEFINHFINDELYSEMFNVYLESGYIKECMPSFTKAKKIKNIEIITYEEAISQKTNATPVIHKYGDVEMYYPSIGAAIRLQGDISESSRTRIEVKAMLDTDNKNTFESMR